MWDPESHYQDDFTPGDNQDHAATTSSSAGGGNGQMVIDGTHIGAVNGVMGSNAASLGGEVHQAQFNPSGVRVKASDWERYAEGLSLRQEEALAEVKRLVSDAVVVGEDAHDSSGEKYSSISHQDGKEKREEERGEDGGSARSGVDAVLQTRSEFYKWFSELELTRASEAEAKYKGHAEALEKHIDVCNDMLRTIDEVLDIFAGLRATQQTISDRTDALKEECDMLVSEREKLSHISDMVHQRLEHFNRLETLSSLFHGPVNAESSPREILEGLEGLDMSLQFTAKHPEFLESGKYNAKFNNLQSRAMSLVKTYFQESVAAAVTESKNTTKMVRGEEQDEKKEPDVDNTEMTLQNVKFRAVLEPKLKELMGGISKHAQSSPQIESLLKDCTSMYCKARFQLVRYNLLTEMQKFGTSIEPLDALKEGSDIVSRSAEVELQLYRQIFSGVSSSEAAASLSLLFDSMCILLSAIVEPMIYASKSNGLDGLCKVNAFISSLVTNKASAPVFGVQSMKKLLEEVEEVVVAEAKSTCKKKILAAGFSEERLEVLDSEAQEFAKSASPPLNMESCAEMRSHVIDFRPVSEVVDLLNQVYPAVGKEKFVELCRGILPDVLDRVHQASESCTDSHGETIGAIFNLRQLALLAECLDAFHVDFSVVPTKSSLAQFGHRLTNQIPILSSFTSGASRKSEVDVHADLTNKLQVARDFCILTCSQEVINPLLSFLTKVTAARVTADGGEKKEIKQHAFASVERVTHLCQSVTETVEGPLFRNLILLAILMTDKELSVIMKTIHENVMDAYSQLETIIQEEYTAEEADTIRLPTRDTVERILPVV
ncbi:hypothetical protein M9434_001202 [Picochlorum sp. BPE23]|nr:hypothetical protein M9434_001202 [Picochlorum sp. BPE23]